MKLLVTGGAGFVGSALVRHLLDTVEGVRVIDLDLLTYAGNPDNLADLEDHPRHELVHGDICDGGLVGEFMQDVDAVVNVAAESHVDRSLVSASPFVKTNVLGTQVLLAAALEAGVSRFVQVSTDEVYGELPWRDPADPENGPDRFTEETPLDPRSPYAASKASADLLALSYYVTHGLEVMVTRSSNNYGPRQFPEKLIPLMVTNTLERRPLPVYGDGLHVRDWLHVDDHCRGIAAALHRGRPGRVYNLGSDTERTNLEVVRAILDTVGAGEELISFVKDRRAHDRRYATDSSRAREELGWRPEIPFEEGLPATVRWYRENRGWWRRVRSGAYRRYHDEMYGPGGRHGPVG